MGIGIDKAGKYMDRGTDIIQVLRNAPHPRVDECKVLRS
jgi:hypothetical protein